MTEVQRRRRTLSAAALVALVALVAPEARAGGAETEAKSRKLFEQAEGLGNDGRWKEACLLYQAAHDLNGTGGTALRAGDCYEKINDFDRALAMYGWVVDHRASDKHPERVAIAEQRVAALTRLKAAQRPGPIQAPPPPLPPPKPNRIPAFVAFGVGGAGAVVGAVFGGLALAQAGSVKANCSHTTPCDPKPGHQTAELEKQASAAKTKAWDANVGIGVGVVGVATGAILFVLGVPKLAQTVRAGTGPEGITLRF
jgi:hypothetical protein